MRRNGDMTKLLLVVLGLRLLLLLNCGARLFSHWWLRRFDYVRQKKVFFGAFFEPLCFCRVFGICGF
jgi:hypothetical protein